MFDHRSDTSACAVLNRREGHGEHPTECEEDKLGDAAKRHRLLQPARTGGDNRCGNTPQGHATVLDFAEPEPSGVVRSSKRGRDSVQKKQEVFQVLRNVRITRSRRIVLNLDGKASALAHVSLPSETLSPT